MERKAKMGMSAMMIVALVFTIIGVTFLPIGIMSYIVGWSVEGDLIVFSCSFAGTGALFLVMGIVFGLIELIKRSRCNRLLKEGYYITAQVVEIDKDWAVRINRRHPYIIRCSYQDIDGTIHVFKSRSLYSYPGGIQEGQTVRVYVDRNNYNDYYVDVDEILGNVVEH